jgi:hypothetical protein
MKKERNERKWKKKRYYDTSFGNKIKYETKETTALSHALNNPSCSSRKENGTNTQTNKQNTFTHV